MTKGNLALAEVQMYTHTAAIFYPSSGIGNENERIETKSRAHEKAKKNEIGTRIRCTFLWFFVRALPVWNESHPLKISMAGSVQYFWISRLRPFTTELRRLFVTKDLSYLKFLNKGVSKRHPECSATILIQLNWDDTNIQVAVIRWKIFIIILILLHIRNLMGKLITDFADFVYVKLRIGIIVLASETFTKSNTIAENQVKNFENKLRNSKEKNKWFASS